MERTNGHLEVSDHSFMLLSWLLISYITIFAPKAGTTDLGKLETLNNLEATFKPGVTQAKVTKPKAKSLRSTVARKDAAVAKDLERISATLDRASLGEVTSPQGITKEQLPAWRRPKARLERPPTPSVGEINKSDEDEELAVIFLQRLLRGRAVQNMMYEGKVGCYSQKWRSRSRSLTHFCAGEES